MEIRRPREDRLPFLCHLNFTAGGGDFGDLVQVCCQSLNSFQCLQVFSWAVCFDLYVTECFYVKPVAAGRSKFWWFLVFGEVGGEGVTRR